MWEVALFWQLAVTLLQTAVRVSKSLKMSYLAVLDFDRTIVDADSDATIIDKLREKRPPPEREENFEWIPYMGIVFEHASYAGLDPEDMLSAIASMPPTPGMEQLLKTLAAERWGILVLSDANEVFVKHWLKANGFEDLITAVITNRAYWEYNKLVVEPYMQQTACYRCPTNMCKALALAQHCGGAIYDRIIYCGDGRNDYCPLTNLPAHSIVFPRLGFPLNHVINHTLGSRFPQIKAKVVPWEHCNTIIEELFPGSLAAK